MGLLVDFPSEKGTSSSKPPVDASKQKGFPHPKNQCGAPVYWATSRGCGWAIWGQESGEPRRGVLWKGTGWPSAVSLAGWLFRLAVASFRCTQCSSPSQGGETNHGPLPSRAARLPRCPLRSVHCEQFSCLLVVGRRFCWYSCTCAKPSCKRTATQQLPMPGEGLGTRQPQAQEEGERLHPCWRAPSPEDSSGSRTVVSSTGHPREWKSSRSNLRSPPRRAARHRLRIPLRSAHPFWPLSDRWTSDLICGKRTPSLYCYAPTPTSYSLRLPIRLSPPLICLDMSACAKCCMLS